MVSLIGHESSVTRLHPSFPAERKEEIPGYCTTPRTSLSQVMYGVRKIEVWSFFLTSLPVQEILTNEICQESAFSPPLSLLSKSNTDSKSQKPRAMTRSNPLLLMNRYYESTRWGWLESIERYNRANSRAYRHCGRTKCSVSVLRIINGVMVLDMCRFGSHCILSHESLLSRTSWSPR